MSQHEGRISPRHAILWMSVAFICVAIVGHIVVAAADPLWVVVGVFGFLAAAQSFAFRASSRDH